MNRIVGRVKRVEVAVGIDKEDTYIFIHFHGEDPDQNLYKKGDFIGQVVIAQKPIKSNFRKKSLSGGEEAKILLEYGYEIVKP